MAQGPTNVSRSHGSAGSSRGSVTAGAREDDLPSPSICGRLREQRAVKRSVEAADVRACEFPTRRLAAARRCFCRRGLAKIRASVLRGRHHPLIVSGAGRCHVRPYLGDVGLLEVTRDRTKVPYRVWPPTGRRAQGHRGGLGLRPAQQPRRHGLRRRDRRP